MSGVPHDFIFVLGMGRSGTSALTSVLTRMGYSVGTSLLEKAPSNPRGFWENRRLMELHDQFLAAHGSSWDDLRLPSQSWWDDEPAREFRRAARIVLEEEMLGHPRIAIKDPRLNRILPLWFPLLEELGVRPSFVIIARHPVEVALSLERRDGFSHERTYLAWMEHNLLAEYWTRGRRRLYIKHGDLIGQTGMVVEKLRSFCGIERTADLSQACAAIDTSLHREKISGRVVDSSNCSFFNKVSALWETLVHPVSGEPSREICDSLHEWYREISGCIPQEFSRGTPVAPAEACAPAVTQAAPGAHQIFLERELQGAEEFRSHMEQRFQAAVGARRAAEKDSKLLRKDIKRMTRLIGLLHETIAKFYASRSWRAVAWISRIGHRKTPRSFRALDKLLEKFDAWEHEVTSRIHRAANAEAAYVAWLDKQRSDSAGISSITKELSQLSFKPCIGLVMHLPADARPALVSDAVASVQHQIFPGWRLFILRSDHLAPANLELPDDERIMQLDAGSMDLPHKVTHLAAIDAECILEPQALAKIALHLARPDTASADLVHTDEDEINDEGIPSNPLLKPEWSPDTLDSFNYIGALAVYRREMLVDIGADLNWLQPGRAYELALAVTARRDVRVQRVPQVLYHQRKLSEERWQARRQTEADALKLALTKRGERAEVSLDPKFGVFHVRRAIARHEPVTIFIPTRDKVHLLQRCLATLSTLTSYKPYEVVILNNDSRDPATLAFLASCGHRVINITGSFNYAAMHNEAVRLTSNPWLVFLNNDTEVVDPGWLNAMAEHVQRPEIAAIGAKLVFPDGTVQHAGVVLGHFNYASHAYIGLPPDDPSGRGQMQIVRNYSAVTAACMMMRREVYERIGGMDAERFAVAYNDVEICVRALRFGYRNVYTPHAVLKHHQSASRQPVDHAIEIKNLFETCIGPAPWSDPYYHPLLNLHRVDFSLSRDLLREG